RAELDIRLAEIFDHEPAQPIAEQENADQFTWLIARVGPPEEEGEHQPEHQPLEARFIELARVARQAIRRIWEDHRPRHVGRPAPKLAIHKIGDASEEQAEGGAAGDIIMDAQPAEPIL